MDIVEVDLQRALGVEFPQITYIEEGLYDRNSGSWRDPNSLEFTLVHEMAHQWWYALVGNDQYQHAFIDEGMANFVSTVYFREVYGDEKADLQVDRNLKLWYLTTLFTGEGDFVVDQPTDDFPSGNAYGATIYGKAALGFNTIYDEIGADAFFTGLRDYATSFRFKVATPDDLRHALERASGRDLTDLWNHWFNAAEGEQDFDISELDRLRQEFGG
jgi:aminopeptidase N